MWGGNTNAIAEEVETATNEKNVEEDWGVIMNICDKAGKSSDEAKSYLRAIVKRLYNSDPHIGVKAVTLLDACVKNSGKIFHTEVASREFENDFTKLMNKAPPNVAKKLRESLKKWAENEFKSDVQLNLIPSLYSKFKNSGLDFSSTETPVKKSAPVSKDPNVVDSQEEEEQILKAIELSLKETSGSPKASTNTTSLYPSVNMASSVGSSTPAKELRKVRALYDFEAAEDNELTFSSGEIIVVIDDSDPNWWKGSNHRGEGLFPANFVTLDLSVEPDKFLYEKAKKMVQFKETVDVKAEEKEPEEIEINEGKIDRLLHLLHEADPTNPEKDTAELLNLEREANGMGPLIDAELERVDRKHAQLTQLSADLVEALGLYHTLMREPQFATVGKGGYSYPQSPNAMTFNGTLPPNMHHPSMMGPPGHPMPGMSQLPGHMPMHGIPQNLPPQHFNPMTMPGPVATNMPLSGPNVPPQGGPPGMPPHIRQQMMEERIRDGSVMGNYPSIPNFGPPGMVPPNFAANGPVPSQTSLQNGLPPQPAAHFVSSSSHHMH